MSQLRTYRLRRVTTAALLRLAFALSIACVAAARAEAQEAMYSDEWGYETPDCEYCLPEAPETYISGVGVTEDDYSSYGSYRVETTIRTPSGRSTSSVAYGDASTRADVSIPVNLLSPEEGDYHVYTHHSETPYEAGSMGSYSTFTNTGFSSILGNLRIAQVRYSLQRSFQDPYYWLYGKDCNSAICRNAPSARWVPKAGVPYPKPYLNYYGVRFTVFFFSWCASYNHASEIGVGCV